MPEIAGWVVCRALLRLMWGVSKGEGGYRELLTLIDEDCREDCSIRDGHRSFKSNRKRTFEALGV